MNFLMKTLEPDNFEGLRQKLLRPRGIAVLLLTFLISLESEFIGHIIYKIAIIENVQGQNFVPIVVEGKQFNKTEGIPDHRPLYVLVKSIDWLKPLEIPHKAKSTNTGMNLSFNYSYSRLCVACPASRPLV